MTTGASLPLLHFVNPYQGTDSVIEFSHGNTIPIAARPWGMHHWSLQNHRPEWGGWFFNYNKKKIEGIRMTHQPSPWMGDYGFFTMLGFTGEYAGKFSEMGTYWDHSKDVFHPNYIRLRLERYRCQMEFTPTERAGVLRLQYGEQVNPGLLIQLTDKEARITQSDSKTIFLETSSYTEKMPPNLRLSVCFRFKEEVSLKLHVKNSETVGEIRFLEKLDFTEVQIGGSWLDHQLAQESILREIGEKSFFEVLKEGELSWENILNKCQISSSTAVKETFYSCAYRAALFPRKFYEFRADGSPVHYSPYTGKEEQGELYTDNGFWDTYRTVYPWISLIYPDQYEKIIKGWVQACREAGWTPKWASPGLRNCMIGTHLDVVFAEAVQKNVSGLDIEEIYSYLRKDAFEEGDPEGYFGRKALSWYEKLGYVPYEEADYSVSRTLDYAYCDYAIASIARKLSRSEDAQILEKRSKFYKNIFDPSTGFMRGRNKKGEWRSSFDPFEWGGDYIEGSAWQYALHVPHDISGLAQCHTSKEALMRKVEEMLKTPPIFKTGSYPGEIHEMSEMASVSFGQYAHSNQPVHAYLYILHECGRKDLSEKHVHRVLKNLYNSSERGFPGDEDNGEMSAWYLLSALGLYSADPVSGQYLVQKPLVEEAIIQLRGGKTLQLSQKNQTPHHGIYKRSYQELTQWG